MKPVINLPNLVSAGRIVLTPVVVWLLLSEDAILVQISALIYALAALSDWYDGWYARRYNAMSAFGRFFDPLADKVLISAIFFTFVGVGLFDLWMVIIIVARDVIVTALRVVADRKNQPVVTSRLAKAKTAMQLVFLSYIVGIFMLEHVDWIVARTGVALFQSLLNPWIVRGSMVVLTLLSVITAVQYLIENRHLLRLLVSRSFARTSA